MLLEPEVQDDYFDSCVALAVLCQIMLLVVGLLLQPLLLLLLLGGIGICMFFFLADGHVVSRQCLQHQ